MAFVVKFFWFSILDSHKLLKVHFLRENLTWFMSGVLGGIRAFIQENGIFHGYVKPLQPYQPEMLVNNLQVSRW